MAGGFWSLSVPSGKTVPYVPELSVTVTRASLGFDIPDSPGPDRGFLNFSYSDGNAEEHSVTIGTFVNAVIENANYRLKLEAHKSYTFESVGPFDIDLVGYYTESLAAPRSTPKAKKARKATVKAQDKKTASSTGKKRCSPSASAGPSGLKKAKLSPAPSGSAPMTRHRSRSLSTLAGIDEEDEDEEDEDDDDDEDGDDDDEDDEDDDDEEEDNEQEEPRKRASKKSTAKGKAKATTKPKAKPKAKAKKP